MKRDLQKTNETFLNGLLGEQQQQKPNKRKQNKTRESTFDLLPKTFLWNPRLGKSGPQGEAEALGQGSRCLSGEQQAGHGLSKDE